MGKSEDICIVVLSMILCLLLFNGLFLKDRGKEHNMLTVPSGWHKVVGIAQTVPFTESHILTE